MWFSSCPSHIDVSVHGRLQEWSSAKPRLSDRRDRQREFDSAGQFGRLIGRVETRCLRLTACSCTPISGKSLPVEPIERLMSVARFHSPV